MSIFHSYIFIFRSRSPISRRLSPLSQRASMANLPPTSQVSLVNPQALLAPGAMPELGPNVHSGVDPTASNNGNSDQHLLLTEGPSTPPPGEELPHQMPKTTNLPFIPAGPSGIPRSTMPGVSYKSMQDMEYEKAVANFLRKNDSKEEPPKRQKRTFTDYPVYDQIQNSSLSKTNSSRTESNLKSVSAQNDNDNEKGTTNYYH